MLARAQLRSVFHGVGIALLFAVLLALMTWSLGFNLGWTESPAAAQPQGGHQSALTALSQCRLDGTNIICVSGGVEYLVRTTATSASELPPLYSGCHADEFRTFCLTPDGIDVEVEPLEASGSGRHCHFHGGVEHCVGEAANVSATKCERIDREYNIPLRIGTLFLVLFASSAGVYGPIFVAAILPPKTSLISAILKQFGTGVIISTAFVHLLTHGILMFQNECLGGLPYEATPAVILMAGIFMSFLAEYSVEQILLWRSAKKRDNSEDTAISAELVNVAILEAGIIFHSLLIGLTLVVTGDNFFGTLALVIIFHQAFEGIALGTRIAALGSPGGIVTAVAHGHHHHHHHYHPFRLDISEVLAGEGAAARVSLSRKLLLASGFAFVTPLGMGIGICVLKVFNGNDPSTIIVVGSIDAFSAGILVWVGVVEMWAHDWMAGGEVAQLDPRGRLLCLAGLLTGMVSMSVLGKWA